MNTTLRGSARIVVTGCCGRMGSRIIALAHQADDLALAGAVESSGHPSVGKDIGECIGVGKLGVRVVDDLARAVHQGDVVVDFSTPDATTANVAIAVKARAAMVIGTTGLNDAQLRAVQQASRTIPILMAPNMSIGVNVLYQLAEQAAELLGDAYDIEIIETHHAGKKDAPSGTAKHLADVLARVRQQQLSRVAVYGRRGEQARGSHQEIGIHAVRAGDVVGDHQVVFATAGERIELTHRASSRDTFAYGALRAARFIAKKSPGLYDMRDALGLK